MKHALIIAAFPGSGKSTLCGKHHDQFLDLDSSRYQENWPHRYLDAIEAIVPHCERTVFVSTHPEVLDGLAARGFAYSVAYPTDACQREYVERIRLRGQPSLAEIVDFNWAGFIEGLKGRSTTPYPPQSEIVLQPGQFLSDVLVES